MVSSKNKRKLRANNQNLERNPLITPLREICLASLNFPLMFCNFPLIFCNTSFYKDIRIHLIFESIECFVNLLFPNKIFFIWQISINVVKVTNVFLFFHGIKICCYSVSWRCNIWIAIPHCSLRVWSARITWVKVFKNGPSKICGRQPLKKLKWYYRLRQTISLQIF